MKRNIHCPLISLIGGFTLAIGCGTARADLVGGAYSTNTTINAWITNWAHVPNLLPQYTSIASSSLSGATIAQGNPAAGAGTHTVLAETFTPVLPISLRGIAIVASAQTAATPMSLHLFDVTTNLTSNNGTIYNGSGATYTPTNIVDLLGNGNGLSFTTVIAGAQQWFFGLTNGPNSNDGIELQTNRTYSLEFWTPVGSQNNFTWYRLPAATPNDPGGQMMAGNNADTNFARVTISSAGLAGGAPRTASMALYSTNFVNPGPSTNAITTLNNPVASSYGPPTVWPYTAGIAIHADGAYTDVPFGTNTVMGETILPTRDFVLRNFYFALNGSTNSGTYTLALYNLGTGGLPASFNPSTNVNLLSHPGSIFPQYWSFTPNGLTNKTMVKFKLGAGDQVILTNGNNYFLGFHYVPGSGSNDMVLERTTSGTTYANGAAYKGSPTSVDNDLGGVRNFIMAIDVLNPNLALNVTNSPLTGAWPGTPMIQYSNPPTAPDYTLPLHVLEGIANGQALSMSFIATKDFNFGGVSLLSRGLGSSNCLFTLAVYDVTNTFFTVTNTIEKWPRNFQPNIDTAPLGVPIFGTNVDFYYTTNLADGGTTDHFLTLTVNNPAYQAQIKSNHSYVVEITAETIGQNANTAGLFQWARDIGQGGAPDGIVPHPFQIELYPPTDNESAGFRTNLASGGTSYNVLPRGLSRNFTDPEQFAGAIAGNVRFLMMAVYEAPAAPPSITITNVSRVGGNTILRWNSQVGPTYSVLRTNALGGSGAWPAIVTGLTGGSYTDTTATATINFYRVSSP